MFRHYANSHSVVVGGEGGFYANDDCEGEVLEIGNGSPFCHYLRPSSKWLFSL